MSHASLAITFFFSYEVGFVEKIGLPFLRMHAWWQPILLLPSSSILTFQGALPKFTMTKHWQRLPRDF